MAFAQKKNDDFFYGRLSILSADFLLKSKNVLSVTNHRKVRRRRLGVTKTDAKPKSMSLIRRYGETDSIVGIIVCTYVHKLI